jgi:hypothetical protein
VSEFLGALAIMWVVMLVLAVAGLLEKAYFWLKGGSD